MSNVDLVLPIPPTVNHHYGQRGKQRFIAKQGKLFRHMVAVEVNNTGYRGEFDSSDRLAVEITLHLPTRRGDIDNRIKPLLDALEHSDLFPNDSQIDRIEVERGDPVKGGRCEVCVYAIK